MGAAVVGGYKATLNNPNTSEEAKQHAKEILEASGYSVEMPAGSTEDEHTVSLHTHVTHENTVSSDVPIIDPRPGRLQSGPSQ